MSDNRVNLIFEIFEGEVIEIEKINFVGNRKYSERRLRGVLKSKQAGIFRKIVFRDNLIKEKIAMDKKLLTEFYKNRGFVDFVINDVNAELSEEKDGFFITYNITEGPQFSIGRVELISNVREIQSEDYLKFSNLKSGEVYSPKQVQINISKLEEKIQAVGFEFIRIRPKITRNISNLSLDIDFLIERGDRLFVERIDISGNTATLDRVVRRQFFEKAIHLIPGKKAADRIRSLGLFSDATVNVLPGSTDSQVVVDVQVLEIPTGSLTFGAGYSSEAGLALENMAKEIF